MPTWTPKVNHTRDGEPVNAAVDGRPTRDLAQRTEYLRSRLDASTAGSALFAFARPVSPDTVVGQPVYFRQERNRFEPAFVDVGKDAGDGTARYDDSAYALGIVCSKESATVATIALSGVVEVSLQSSTGSASPAGPLYLSHTPGKIDVGTPRDGPYLGFADGSGRVYLASSLRDFLASHEHLSFSLACKPAGDLDPPSVNGRHVISSPDPARRGWLPANHVSFAGSAPSGAAFGYNLAEDPDLAKVWPPRPLSGVAVYWDKGLNQVGATEVPLGLTGLVVVDAKGIWWMSNCYGDVPWPTSGDYLGSDSNTSLPHSSGGLECERLEDMRLTIAFTQHATSSSRFAVTELFSGSDSLRVVDCVTGEPASTGALRLELDAEFLVEDVEDYSGLALKSQDGAKFQRGKAVSGVSCPDGSISISSPEDPFTVSGKQYYPGLLELSVGDEPGDRLVPVQVVRLSDVAQRYVDDVFYLGFREDQDSEVRVSLKVPYAVAQATPKLSIRLTVYATVTGTTPALSMTYRRIPRSTNPASLPLVDAALPINTAKACTNGQYFEASSDPFTVAVGDLVLVSISRSAADAYAGEIGLIEVAGVLSNG